MIDIFFWLRILIKTAFKDRCNLVLENMALRQQWVVLKRTQKRLPLQNKDRLAHPFALGERCAGFSQGGAKRRTDGGVS
jgi:hypothetical protein